MNHSIRVQGVFSVEGAMVFALLFLTIETLILATFWIHDRTVLYILAQHTLALENQMENEQLQEKFLQEAQEELYILKVTDAVFSEDQGHIEMTITAVSRVEAGKIVLQMLSHEPIFTCSLKVSKELDAVMVLRGAHGLIWR